ncbi:MAG: glycosyltransferase family 2 protein [marine benthic group bacterium]|nr:glycosyltransferase family 2 protein [Gemmatimonadota bacterium]
MKPLTSVTAVVPVYNAEATLAVLCEELSRALPGVAERWDILLVNDGSRDRSWTVIKELAATRPEVRGLNLWRNFGQHPALLCGTRHATGDFVLTLDDDLQFLPADVSRLAEAMTAEIDVVYGTPTQKAHKLWRRIASHVLRRALELAVGASVARVASPFRLFRTQIRDGFKSFSGPYVSLDVLLAWSAGGFSAVEVEHQTRHAGRSQYTIRKLAQHALDLITGFSPRPLRFASYLGFGFTVIGVVVLVFVVGRYLIEGGSVPGFPFLASLIAIFSGAQLFTLGIMGQYLGRVHQRSLDRPAYVLRERTPE